MAAEFGRWLMSPWLSPGAAWFIVFNVLVGAIAVMSSARGQQDGRARRRLLRTASTVVLDSLRSISLFPFHAAGDYSVVAYSAPASQLHYVQEQQHYTFQEQETHEKVTTQLREHEAASVAEEESGVLPQTAAAAAPDVTATASESNVEDGESSISLDQAYALARARRQAPIADPAADTVARVPVKKDPVAEGNKGRTYPEEVEGKAEVNVRAERFIRQFREELKLERVNSILNYTHTLRRGSGAAVPR